MLEGQVDTFANRLRKAMSIRDIKAVELSQKTNISTNSGRSGATTEVKAVGVNYIIKAKMVAMPSDFMSKVDEAVEDALAITHDNPRVGPGWSKGGSVIYQTIGKICIMGYTVSNGHIGMPDDAEPVTIQLPFHFYDRYGNKDADSVDHVAFQQNVGYTGETCFATLMCNGQLSIQSFDKDNMDVVRLQIIAIIDDES